LQAGSQGMGFLLLYLELLASSLHSGPDLRHIHSEIDLLTLGQSYIAVNHLIAGVTAFGRCHAGAIAGIPVLQP